MVRRLAGLSVPRRFRLTRPGSCADEDMSEMYLSEKLTRTSGEERDIKDHTEVEILLESVQKQVEEIVNEVETTIVRDPTLDGSSFRTNPDALDRPTGASSCRPTSRRRKRSLSSCSTRTATSYSPSISRCERTTALARRAFALILLSVLPQVSIMTLGVGSAALLAGLGGMNVSRFRTTARLVAAGLADPDRRPSACQLQNHFETHPNMFYYITSLAVTLAVISSMVGLRHLRKVMRIGLADSDTAAHQQYIWLDKVGRPAGAGLIGKSVTERTTTLIPPAGASISHSPVLPDSAGGVSTKPKLSRGLGRRPL
jgi:hypothetical protein